MELLKNKEVKNLKSKDTNLFLASMRSIAIDAINQAGGGHLGMALGASEIFYAIVAKNLHFSSKNPKRINRDRFVLSAGHGSMGLYSLYHLMGLISLEEIKQHKQLHSQTPSHPEVDKLDYIDASTGPLGQGIAMAVGMALAEQKLANYFNYQDFLLINHYTYVLCGDGDLQEGVALEALAFAATNKLSKLIVIHDYNDVQIDTRSSEVNSVDFQGFFSSLGFHTIILKDNQVETIDEAIKEAQNSNLPTYIQVPTIIAFQTQFANQSLGHHGSLNLEQTIDLKTKLNLTNFQPFNVENSVYQMGQKLLLKKEQAYQKWENLFTAYQKRFPDLAQKFVDFMNKKEDISIENLVFAKQNLAIRDYVGQIITTLNQKDLFLLGGSADLAVATKVQFTNPKRIDYGIREFAMAAINNGILLHSNFRTISSTFLSFSDYGKPALRMASLMKLNPIYIFSHDSYQVGGDGPTHQPVEQLGALRAIPNFLVVRPCDDFETLEGFSYLLNLKDQPSALIASRQPLVSYNKLEKFAPAYYIDRKINNNIILLASGSEVSLACKVASELEKYNIIASVVSVPILQLLVDDAELIKKLELDKVPLFAIEASNDTLWYKLAVYQKFAGRFAKDFGESAPGQIVYELKGFSPEFISQQVLKFLEK
ncbi:transketolase-like TK C-terminal-containing protein [Mesomycoplasma conjunctivae]|uniref:transketolase-like TK C-terminal-containing protein n=1 Tax=Mesomycoplasma conjunctivae TaxID=45361 RepID=UPI00068113FA|nr:transketolase [Mesomycoplasma conjunctivae]